MKHYDEWYTVYIKKVGYNKSGATYTKAAYRAALEWVLKNKTDMGYAGEAIPADIIRRELNED